jgi:hypothetical protein
LLKSQWNIEEDKEYKIKKEQRKLRLVDWQTWRKTKALEINTIIKEQLDQAKLEQKSIV